MGLTTFQIATAAVPQARIGLEPVFNALNSMALLNLAETQPALDSWVQRTAAAMTASERHTNQLIFTCLGAALVAHGAAADFEAFLDALTRAHPEALRDRVLAELAVVNPAAPAAPQPTTSQLLGDGELYLSQVQRLAGGVEVERALYAEAHALLNDPFRMHDVIVSHARALWDRALAPEWARVQRSLENQARLLQDSTPNSGLAPERIMEKLQSLLGPAAGRAAQELVFVPSPHTGRYTSELRAGGTCCLFFDAQLNYPVLLRESPVGETELIGRLSALTEPVRLQVLELLARRDELTMQEIMEQLDVSQPNASRYLKSLGIYIAERRAKDGKKHYRLVPLQLELTFSALKQRILSAGSPDLARDRTERDAHAEGAARWFNARSTLMAWPAREPDRLAVLGYLAGYFQAGEVYSEREVNAIITEHVHPYVRDHVTIRRDLVDFQFLGRASDGSRYWRNAERAAGPGSQPAPLDQATLDP